MFALPSLPAGQYRIHLNGASPRGWAMIGIARESRDPFALRTLPLPAGAVDLTFPLPVRALVIRGDEEAWRTIRGLVIEPLSVFRPMDRLADSVARRAVRYGESTVYFLDDRSYPEPEGFWVGGARSSTVVIQPGAPRGIVADPYPECAGREPRGSDVRDLAARDPDGSRRGATDRRAGRCGAGRSGPAG